MVRKYLSLLLLAAYVGVLAGCNTMKGLGQDIERGGEKLQSKSDEVKRNN